MHPRTILHTSVGLHQAPPRGSVQPESQGHGLHQVAPSMCAPSSSAPSAEASEAASLWPASPGDLVVVCPHAQSRAAHRQDASRNPIPTSALYTSNALHTSGRARRPGYVDQPRPGTFGGGGGLHAGHHHSHLFTPRPLRAHSIHPSALRASRAASNVGASTGLVVSPHRSHFATWGAPGRDGGASTREV